MTSAMISTQIYRHWRFAGINNNKWIDVIINEHLEDSGNSDTSVVKIYEAILLFCLMY